METNKVKAILIGAGQRGAQVYGAFARRNPNDIVFVAVAEPDEARRKEFCRDHGICPDNAVEDWHELLERRTTSTLPLQWRLCRRDTMW